VHVVECGFLTSEPGARAQAFHSDTSPPGLDACESAALKVQLALVEVDETMGPLEVVPGSHASGGSATGSHASGGSTAGSHASGGSTAGSHSGGGSRALSRKGVGGGGTPNTTSATTATPVLAHRLLVRPGDVTVYWSTVQHRGSANVGNKSRPTFHIAIVGDGGAPTGMPYTVLASDVIAKYGTPNSGFSANYRTPSTAPT